MKCQYTHRSSWHATKVIQMNRLSSVYQTRPIYYSRQQDSAVRLSCESQLQAQHVTMILYMAVWCIICRKGADLYKERLAIAISFTAHMTLYLMYLSFITRITYISILKEINQT